MAIAAQRQRLSSAWVNAPRAVRIAVAAVAALVVWALAHAMTPRGVPLGIVLVGVVVGSLYGLVATGIILVYRANKVVNFSQAEFGSVAAVVAIELVIQSQVNYFVSVAVGLLLALALGAVIDVVVIRRFRKAPRLILAVVTIGLAQILNGIAIVIPLLWSGLSAGRFTTPFTFSATVDPVRFNGNHLVAVITVAVLMSGLGLFLRFSSYGIAIRAAAENGDRAGLLGVPVARLSTVVWAVAGLLSASAAILRVPIVGFASFASVSGAGSALLLRTLAAAVIARMESLPRAFVAAVALGVFQESANWNLSRTTVVDAMLVVIILGALLLQRDLLSRAAETGIATWKAIK